MPKPIERLRYFDGEYLRSDDMAAEQAYHLRMRRMLNRELHRFGVARGLQLGKSPDAQKVGIDLYIVTPGVALDALGREIVVEAAQAIDSALMLRNELQNPGQYQVWLCYSERPATPPATGFQACNLDDAMTRWREDFEIVLVENKPPAVTDAVNLPRAGLAGVPLGVIQIDSALNVLGVTKEHREAYVGVNAEEIDLPERDLKETKFRHATSPPNPRSWLTVQPNLAVLANETIGKDYALPDADFKTAPATTDIPDEGNLKLAASLFVKGKYFQWDPATTKWLTLDELLTAKMKTLLPTLMPDVQAGAESVVVSNTTTAGDKLARGTHTFSISSLIKNLDASTSRLVVGVSAAKLHGKKDLNTWRNNITDTLKITFEIGNATITGSGGNYTGSFDWVAGPFSNADAGDVFIESFSVNWVVVLKATP